MEQIYINVFEVNNTLHPLREGLVIHVITTKNKGERQKEREMKKADFVKEKEEKE